MDISKIKRDSNKISEGQWVRDIPECGSLTLKVRGMSSPVVQALMSRKLRAIPKEERERDGSPNIVASTRVLAEVLHEAVLLDWGGLSDEGKPVKYNSALAKKWLTDPDFKPFADAVSWAARAVDSGDAEMAETAEGN